MAVLLISAGHIVPVIALFAKGEGKKKGGFGYTSGRSGSRDVWAGVSCLP